MSIHFNVEGINGGINVQIRAKKQPDFGDTELKKGPIAPFSEEFLGSERTLGYHRLWDTVDLVLRL